MSETTPAAAASAEAAEPEVKEEAQAAPAADEAQGETLLTEKEPEGEKTEGEETPPAKAPEAYEPFKTLNDAPLDQEVLGEFTTLAKELDLTQEQAQSLVDLQGRYTAKVYDQVTQEHKETIAKWRTEVETDPEIGGVKLKETQAAAQRALERFGDKGLKQLLNDSGLGNHPGLVRLLAKVDKATKDDTMVEGSPAGRAKPKALHEALYRK